MKLPLRSKLSLLGVSSVALMFAIGCGKKVDTTQDQAKGPQTANDVAKTASDIVNSATGANTTQHKSSEHAVDAKVLASAIPNISGYTAHEPSTSSAKMQDIEWSTAERDFDNGDKHIKVTLADYNYSQNLTAAYSMFMNFSSENENEIQKGEKVGNFPGWINWKKKDNQGQIGFIVNDRFYVIVEGNGGVSLDDLRSVATQVNTDVLSKASN